MVSSSVTTTPAEPELFVMVNIKTSEVLMKTSSRADAEAYINAPGQFRPIALEVYTNGALTALTLINPPRRQSLN